MKPFGGICLVRRDRPVSCRRDDCRPALSLAILCLGPLYLAAGAFDPGAIGGHSHHADGGGRRLLDGPGDARCAPQDFEFEAVVTNQGDVLCRCLRHI